jgi:hypothetical protein
MGKKAIFPALLKRRLDEVNVAAECAQRNAEQVGV